MEKMNDYFENSSNWKDYQLNNINKIEDLVNKSNSFYSFMVFGTKDEDVWQWYVEARYKNNELYIDEIVPCL